MRTVGNIIWPSVTSWPASGTTGPSGCRAWVTSHFVFNTSERTIPFESSAMPLAFRSPHAWSSGPIAPTRLDKIV